MRRNTTNPALIVVRHAPVDERYRGICYGSSDAILGPEGERLSHAVVRELAGWKHARIVHSGLQRTQFLAERLAEQFDCRAAVCEELQERDFGDWEMQTWNEIHARHGDEMLRMISEPETYRPGGGETTFEMRDRVLRWYHGLPMTELTIAITHGGPIASLLGSRRQLPVTEWMELIPRCGQILPIQEQEVEQG